MTNEEAFKLAMQACKKTWNEKTCKQIKEALEQEPCDDAISRKDIQDYIAKYLSQYLYEDVRQAVEAIDTYIGDMPSVTQKPGKWIRWREEVQRGTHCTENIPHCKCSECGKEYDPYSSHFIKYCNECGVKMQEVEDNG